MGLENRPAMVKVKPKPRIQEVVVHVEASLGVQRAQPEYLKMWIRHAEHRRAQHRIASTSQHPISTGAW